MPGDERLFDDDSRITGRRRHVTLLFSDLCGSTSLADALDPEDLASILGAVKAAASQVVARHEGVANQFYGDGVLAVFGLPSPREDDARRAIDAALELHDVIRGMALGEAVPPGFTARLHSGIHAGVVFAARGDAGEGRYVLTGDAIHVAARLCSSAGADEILVSERTVRSVRTFFEVEDLEPLSLRGFAEPEPACRILGRTTVGTRFEARARGGLTPFVGREAELAALMDTAERAMRGEVSILGVVGAAGMGKTRFLHRVREVLAGDTTRVLYGYCESYGTVGPLQPIRQVLRTFFDPTQTGGLEDMAAIVTERLRALRPELLHYAPAYLEVLGFAGEGPELVHAGSTGPRAVEAVGELFRALCTEGFCVVIIDDWQWADDASRHVVDGIIRAVEEQAFLLVTASRSNEVADPLVSGAPIIELAPLRPEEVGRVIQAMLPRAPEISVVEQIHRRSGGNPLFLEELCHSLDEWAPSDHRTREGQVPPSLHSLIQARVERLPPKQADLLATAAVAGAVVSRTLLDALGVDCDAGSLSDLARADLLFVDGEGRLRFKHGITRDVVYESVSLRKRRELHGRIAQALEAREPESAEALAVHCAAAGDHERAARFAEVAGDRAVAVSALSHAIHHFRAAMAALERLGDTPALRRRWISVCLRWAGACIYTPAPDQIEVLARAVEYCRSLDRPVELAQAEYTLGWIWHAIGNQRHAIAHFEAALSVARRLEHDLLIAQSQHSLGVSYGMLGQHSQAIEYIDLGVEGKKRLYEALPTPPMSTGSAYALAIKGLVIGDRGDFSRAAECFEEALAMVRGASHAVEASILGIQVILLLRQGLWNEAADVAERQRALARRTHAPYSYAMSEIMRAYAEFQLDPRAESIDRMQRHIDWLDARGIRLFQSYCCYAAVADVRVAMGDFQGARQYAWKAIRRGEDGDQDGAPLALRTLARCCEGGLRGPGESAETFLNRALASARARGARWDEAITLLALAEYNAAAGRTPEARALCEQARAELEAMGMRGYRERADRLLATLQTG